MDSWYVIQGVIRPLIGEHSHANDDDHNEWLGWLCGARPLSMQVFNWIRRAIGSASTAKVSYHVQFTRKLRDHEIKLAFLALKGVVVELERATSGDGPTQFHTMCIGHEEAFIADAPPPPTTTRIR